MCLFVLYSKLTVTFLKKETMSFGGVFRSTQLSSSVSLCLFMFFFLLLFHNILK